MTKDEIHQDYVSKAQEAEENANKATEPEVIRGWRKIADGYLLLANSRLPPP